MITIFKRTNPLQGLSLQELYQEYKNNEAELSNTIALCDKYIKVHDDVFGQCAAARKDYFSSLYDLNMNYNPKNVAKESADRLYYTELYDESNHISNLVNYYKKRLKALEKRQAKLSKMISKLEEKEQQNNNQPQ